MLHYLKEPLVSFFKIIKRWIFKQPAGDDDSFIELPINFPEHTTVDSDGNLLVDSLMNLQDIPLGEISPNKVVKKLKEEHIEMLIHIINIKVSDLINRMNNKVDRVPMNSIVKCAKVIFPRIEITGSSLLLWFVNTMDLTQDEALYLSNLLSSHIIMFTIFNHYLTVLNVGCFYRNLPSTSQMTYKDHLNDYDYAVYLCKKEYKENVHGDLLDFKLKKRGKAKVDFNKWEFEFQPAENNPRTSNNNYNQVAEI